MVDGAHAPHFSFLQNLGFPCPAEAAGADLVTQSTHKVLSALNQGSLLHFNNVDLIPRYEEFQAMGFQSTSFSYLILISIEHAIEQMVTDGERLWARAVKEAQRLREGARSLPGVQVLDDQIVDGVRIVGLDPTRVTLNVHATGLSGHAVSAALLRRGVMAELATADVVLFFVSPSAPEELQDATLNALREIVSGGADRRDSEVLEPPALPQQVLTPRQAAFSMARERVSTSEAVGRISAETIGCFPPGQAILVAGERVAADSVDYLSRAVAAGGHLKRVQDDGFRTVVVIQEPH